MLMFALGVTSGKENRWFKDISQISADPPSPNLIFDFFILDKYKLVFTPSHSKMSEIKIILNFWFELDPLPYLTYVFKSSGFLSELTP